MNDITKALDSLHTLTDEEHIHHTTNNAKHYDYGKKRRGLYISILLG